MYRKTGFPLTTVSPMGAAAGTGFFRHHMSPAASAASFSIQGCGRGAVGRSASGSGWTSNSSVLMWICSALSASSVAMSGRGVSGGSVSASSGGGMVTVEADGKGQVTRIKIDPSIVDAREVEMLEDLVVVAVTEAQKKAAEMAKEEMGKLAGGLNLPFSFPG